METQNLIKFLDWGTSGHKGSAMKSNELSVWYNLKNKNYSITFSNDLDTDKKYIRFGKLGDNIAICFNNDSGVKISRVGKLNKNMKVDCKDFVQHFFSKLDKEKDRKILKFKKITNDILIIE
jgi:hypothetical protein